MAIASVSLFIGLCLIFGLQFLLCRSKVHWLGILLPLWYLFDGAINGFTYVVYRNPDTATFTDGVFIFSQSLIPALMLFGIYYYFRKKRISGKNETQ